MAVLVAVEERNDEKGAMILLTSFRGIGGTLCKGGAAPIFLTVTLTDWHSADILDDFECRKLEDSEKRLMWNSNSAWRDLVYFIIARKEKKSHKKAHLRTLKDWASIFFNRYW